MKEKTIKLLFIGDIFGDQAIIILEKKLPQLIKKLKIDFVIAQGENVSGRKGLIKSDYEKLKNAGVNAITLGNHIWAKPEIELIINKNDLVRPYNVDSSYPGQGSRVFLINGVTLRVTSLLGITFNELTTGWNQSHANNFFDAFDEINKDQQATYHFIDFHGETTSEKNVFSLYIDGKADVMVGTHTHVQTNDARILPKGLAYITDVGMTGPSNAAIGADYNSVYQKMRFNSRSKFKVSSNPIQFNGVLISLNQQKKSQKTVKTHTIKPLNFMF